MSHEREHVDADCIRVDGQKKEERFSFEWN